VEVVPNFIVPVASVGHLLALKILSRDDGRRPNDLADLHALLSVATPEDIETARAAVSLITDRGFNRERDLSPDLEALISGRRDLPSRGLPYCGGTRRIGRAGLRLLGRGWLTVTQVGAGLRLEVRGFVDATTWRWVLTDDGNPVAEHDVALDPREWQYEAFTDLLGYLSWHVAPDHRADDEARVVAELGAWIGEQVIGPSIAGELVARRPVTVRVCVPGEARMLAFRPLELAHADGRPLAAQDVTLVMEADSPSPAGPTDPVGDRLRVLGLFSLPEGGQPLNLRRERHALVRLIEGIDAVGQAAEVRVLQYGVTRDRLRDALEDADGWDIIHVSGHGAPGELLLETADGRPDQVSAAELAGLLDLARGRVKLVTISACWSAALSAA
jgi:hypothetical protein